jgi:hypothetical protein
MKFGLYFEEFYTNLYEYLKFTEHLNLLNGFRKKEKGLTPLGPNPSLVGPGALDAGLRFGLAQQGGKG